MLLLAACTFQTISVTELPTPLGSTQVVMRETVNWIKAQHISGRVHYSDPVFYYFAGREIDVESPVNKGKLLPNQLSGLMAGDYIAWDAHFSPNEGQLPLDSLLEHAYFELIKTFRPEKAFTVLGSHPYAVHLFRKTKTPSIKHLSKKVLLFQNFESDSSNFLRGSTSGRDGSSYAIADADHEYVTIQAKLSPQIVDRVRSFDAEVWVRSESPADEDNFSLVSEISSEGEGFHYLATGSNKIKNHRKGEWNRMTQSFELPENLPDSFELKCYIWNPNGLEILIDDFKLEAISVESFIEPNGQ